MKNKIEPIEPIEPSEPKLDFPRFGTGTGTGTRSLEEL